MTDLPFLTVAWVSFIAAMAVGLILGWMAYSLFEARLFRHFDSHPDKDREIG